MNTDPYTRWKSPDVAGRYDKLRFKGLIGHLNCWLHTRAILRLIDSKDNVKSIMDIPCGTGVLMNELSNSSRYNLYGLDISSPMLNMALKNTSDANNIQLIQGNGESIPLPRNSLDVVICIRLFGHLPRNLRRKMLNEFRRVSNKYIIVEYELQSAPVLFAKKLLNYLTINRKVLNSVDSKAQWHRVTKTELYQELNDEKFKISKIKYKLWPFSEAVFVKIH